MGLGMSEEDHRERERELKRDVKKFKNCANVMVNRAIVTFCSVSSDSLQKHLNKRKKRDYPVADWMQKLAEKLANLSPSPNIAGLGALAVAVFIDIISATSSSENMKDALRCVFAEEKASEVWDHIDECLKRCIVYIDDDDEQISEIMRLEPELSKALTKLKNSMTNHGQMSSAALKAWVNGAAFHIHMLIHLLRLGGSQTCNPVERYLSIYLNELDTLFRAHKAAVKKKCDRRDFHNFDNCLLTFFETDEGEEHSISPFFRFEEFFEAYYEEHYSSQEYEIRKYFRNIRENLATLVHVEGTLSIC
ncbi:uncharacterized protein LOC143334564 [Chaetodon auriga]|uniref:uncharacterized protein LOC143334564 n=1 Tax=Chaetodon auriga TaxID=39042 RepID=UPI004032B44B